MTGNVVVIGDALIDELRSEGDVGEFVGGAALNVAVGLSRLGVPATLIAMVGDDAAGAQIRAFLERYDVALLASPSERGSSRAVSTRNPGGEPEYVFNDAAQHRRVRFGEAERAALADAPMVVVSCFPFDDAGELERLGAAVRASGAPLAIDPNPRAGMLHDRAEFVRGFESLARGARLVKVGDDDAALLYDRPLDALRARLIELGVEAVLATRGADGAMIESGAVVVSAPVAELPGRIVDTMGAGDAVLAATAARLAAEIPVDAAGWQDVLDEAMSVAAATCRAEGALLQLPGAAVESDAAPAAD